jgi:hypothetical protein
MKALAILPAIVGAISIGIALEYPTYTLRYRLTVEVDTPEGVRSGSSVIQVARSDVSWFPLSQVQFSFDLRGEAVFVDLGANRNLIALLVHGTRADNFAHMASLAVEAYGYRTRSDEAWAGKVQMQGPVELKPPLIPTFVTFSDLSDPKTARGLQPDELPMVFGPGVTFRMARIETVPAGTWPFRALSWPRALAGEPVTTGIEKRLPWLPGRRGQPGYLNGPKPDLSPGALNLNGIEFSTELFR